MPPKKPEKGQATLASFFKKAASPAQPTQTAAPAAAPAPAPVAAPPAAAAPVEVSPVRASRAEGKTPSPKRRRTSPGTGGDKTPVKTPAKATPKAAKASAKPAPKSAAKPAAKKAAAKPGGKADKAEKVEKTEEEKEKARRRFAAMRGNYDNSALDKGSKPVPVGDDACLEGMTFLVTGRMEAFDRADMESLIKKHGGAMRTGVTKRLSYLVKGAEPGESKVRKAEELKTSVLTEDELIRLVVDKSEEKGVDAWRHIGDIDRATWGGEQFAAAAAAAAAQPAQPPRAAAQPAGGAGSSAAQALLLDDDDDDDVAVVGASGPAPVSTVFNTVHNVVTGRVQPKQHVEVPATPAEQHEVQLWADKYAPKKVSEVLGHGAKAQELRSWLSAWKLNARIYKENPKGKMDWKAGVLISGPPGIGKTTLSRLIAQECGYDVIERNASDNRTQRTLRESVTCVLGSRSILSMMQGAGQPQEEKERDVVIIMDEVGGLDRGGTTEIIAMLKQARTPIICICNDKHSQKLKGMAGHLMDMPFSRPPKQTVAAYLKKKLRECEGIDIHEQALINVIEAAGNDLRATLNNLQMWSRTTNRLTYDMVTTAQGTAQKDTDLSPFAAAQRLFSGNLSIQAMGALYFDNDLLGLFVQENYVHSGGSQGSARLPTLSKVARSLACADMMDRTIRSENKWSLGSSAAFHACAYPLRAMGKCSLTSYLPPGARQYLPCFPGYLGKLSTTNKNIRLSVELAREANSHEDGMQGGRHSIVGEYIPTLRRKLESQLKEGDAGAAASSLAGYGMCKLDWDFAQEVDTFKKMKRGTPHPVIETKTKSAMTRALNKMLDSKNVKMRRGSVAAPTMEVDANSDEGSADSEENDGTQTQNDSQMSAPKKASAKAGKKSSAKPAAKKPGGKSAGKKRPPADAAGSASKRKRK